jgi:hypothetical protein
MTGPSANVARFSVPLSLRSRQQQLLTTLFKHHIVTYVKFFIQTDTGRKRFFAVYSDFMLRKHAADY